MDYITAQAPPHPLKINGKEFSVPRFLGPEFSAYVAQQRAKVFEEALGEIRDEERRATFRMYHQSPPMDIAFVAKELTTPDGADHVIRVCLVKAGVPKEEIDGFIANVDPELKRGLVDELRSGNGMIVSQLQASGDNPKNPTTGQPLTSGGSPEIISTTSQTLQDSSADATQAA